MTDRRNPAGRLPAGRAATGITVRMRFIFVDGQDDIRDLRPGDVVP